MPKIRWRLYPFKGEEALRKALQTSCSGRVHATHPLPSPPLQPCSTSTGRVPTSLVGTGRFGGGGVVLLGMGKGEWS